MDSTPAPAARPNRAGRRLMARRAAAAGSAAAVVSSMVALGAAVAPPAGAAEFSVTNCDDTGAGSLRQAVEDANSASGADVITITASCPDSGPVAVASPMTMTESVQIDGPGADAFVLDGGGATEVFVIDMTDDSTFTLSGLTIQNGSSSTDGGGIRQEGSWAVDVTIAGVHFHDNHADSNGGAVQLDTSTSGTITITDSVFEGNDADGDAGALYILYSGDVVITNSTFEGNSAGSNGGAIDIYEQPGNVEIYNSTITGNTSGAYGGGLAAEGVYHYLTLAFVTVTDNVAAAEGGGIYVTGETNELTIIGGLFAGNTSGGGGEEVDSSADTVTENHNLFEGSVEGFTPDASDILGEAPVLGALGDNGGPTPTQALLAGSPAIDKGPTTLPTFPGNGFDQRGNPYVREYNGRSDIGAFESQPEPTPEPEPVPVPLEPTFTG